MGVMSNGDSHHLITPTRTQLRRLATRLFPTTKTEISFPAE